MIDNTYAKGLYEFKDLKIGTVRVNAQVEVFRQEPISRNKPTAFVAGHGYEKQLGDYPIDKVIYRAEELGILLGKTYTLITGHCQGVPSYVAEKALKEGASVIGLSAFSDKDKHLESWKKSKIYTDTTYNILPEQSASIAVHTGLGFWHRDVCNAELTNNHRQHVYIVGGYEGTNHELDVSIAMHSIIGALLGVGGISGDIDSVIAHYKKHNIPHYIVKDTEPKALVEKVNELDKKLKEGNEALSTTPLRELLDTLESRVLIGSI